MKVQDIRAKFCHLLLTKEFVSVNREATLTNIVGSRTIEIVGASFEANEDAIFGIANQEYIAREELWYDSMSLNVNDIPGGPPEIWKRCADKDGFINSNYGWCIFHPENGRQYENAVNELKKNPESRRATMIYTRPSIWNEYDLNGRSDFICTNAVQFLIRNGKLDVVVQMRSNDTIFGYRNDFAWHKHVQDKACQELQVSPGKIFWQVGSLHVYEKDFYLVHHYMNTGEKHITKENFRVLYPLSTFAGTKKQEKK